MHLKMKTEWGSAHESAQVSRPRPQPQPQLGSQRPGLPLKELGEGQARRPWKRCWHIPGPGER